LRKKGIFSIKDLTWKTQPNGKDDTGKSPFVLVAESFNVNTGLGSRFGTELLKRGFKGAYNNLGTNREGSGGLWQQMVYQGVDPQGIAAAVRKLNG
jgi:hypothetical protein